MSEQKITNADIDAILDVNKKAVEIHSEVGRQNEVIIEALEDNDKLLEKIDNKINILIDITKSTNDIVKDKMEKKIDEIEKNLFRLIAILSTIGVGTIIAIVQAYLRK